MLSSIAVTAPTATLAPGAARALTATGTEIGGQSMPITDPASHVRSSGESRIASVDAVTGVVTAHRAGTVTVSVRCGSVVGSVQLGVS